ncbi:RNA binding protein [Loa loa]|uniref:RNA binding protein n=1 Tax=Loa loa TaxID=7209 RepID=A0A1I7W0K5_LOALO|nr:RNA binding protein [Loa loa]EFO21147.1 RNA binding protein [Loa loa]
MEEVKTEQPEVITDQPEVITEEVVEAETKTETATETVVETEAEETAVTTATEKEVDPNTSNYIRLRGLPFSAKEDDVRAFLEGLEVRSVTFTLTSMGRASGECYVELVDKAAAEEAKRFDKQEMNNRYIEVFNVTESEVVWMTRHNVIRKGDQDTPYNFVVRLRGIPFSATNDDVKEFFTGLEVADVVIDKELGGRPSGEAFVRFASKQHAEMALERNRNNMGSRYVEVFRSSGDELEKSKEGHIAPPTSLRSLAAERSFPAPRSEPIPLRFATAKLGGVRPYRREEYGGPLRNVGMSRPRAVPYDVPYSRYSRFQDYSYDDDFDCDDPAKVYMRGLPYSANALDIEDFFKPLNCVEIQLGFNEDRRPSGDACVIFGTLAEARDAMSRNKQCIGNRYIELFTAADVPITQKYVIYRRIGGTGDYPSAISGGGSRGPTALNRVNCGGYDEWLDNDVGNGRYSSVQSKPVSLNRVGYATSDPADVGGAEGWSDADSGRGYSTGYSNATAGYNASYATGGQQYYNDEYEGKQSSYGYQWSSAGSSVKTSW